MKIYHLLSIILLTLSPVLSAEEIYREVDEDGVPSFSDTRGPDSETVELRKPTTYNPVAKRKTVKLSPPEESPTDMIPNYQLKVINKLEEDTIRDNAGNLDLEVEISPGLQAGHRAELIMDGAPIRSISASGPIALTNIDRGTHQFALRVLNKQNKVIATGETTTITLLRYSKLSPSP